MTKTVTLTILAVLVVGSLVLINKYYLQRVTDLPQQVFEPTINIEELEGAPAITAYVSDRRVIWAMDFLPDGRMVFTERSGAVHIVQTNGRVEEILRIDVLTTGESGLHGVAIDPNFTDNNFVYLYYTYRANGADTLNRVSRYRFVEEVLGDEQVLVDNIPGASTHDGGRLKFGPDGFLYITTGDAAVPSLSQDQTSLAGKILRVTSEGQSAAGNPFDTHVYSYGHRNPQGITWDNTGRLWATEHGPSARDELNLIEAGVNYGWPEITGTDTREKMRSPIIQSGQGTWAPAGAAYYDGSIYFAGLRGSALYQYDIEANELTSHLKDRLGRIRDVILGPDGFLYVATSNRDGRGIPASQDDRILRINPLKLGEL